MYVIIFVAMATVSTFCSFIYMYHAYGRRKTTTFLEWTLTLNVPYAFKAGTSMMKDHYLF